MKKPTPGQAVFVVENAWRAKDEPKTYAGRVATVGRKYFTVFYGHPHEYSVQAHLETWREKTDYTARVVIYESEQAWKDERERDALRGKIRELATYGDTQAIPLEDLRAIAALMKPAERPNA